MADTGERFTDEDPCETCGGERYVFDASYGNWGNKPCPDCSARAALEDADPKGQTWNPCKRFGTYGGSFPGGVRCRLTGEMQMERCSDCSPVEGPK